MSRYRKDNFCVRCKGRQETQRITQGYPFFNKSPVMTACLVQLLSKMAQDIKEPGDVASLLFDKSLLLLTAKFRIGYQASPNIN